VLICQTHNWCKLYKNILHLIRFANWDDHYN
jgi:hypothetical protein